MLWGSKELDTVLAKAKAPLSPIKHQGKKSGTAGNPPRCGFGVEGIVRRHRVTMYRESLLDCGIFVSNFGTGYLFTLPLANLMINKFERICEHLEQPHLAKPHNLQPLINLLVECLHVFLGCFPYGHLVLFDIEAYWALSL
jgi:hypothetical protein